MSGFLLEQMNGFRGEQIRRLKIFPSFRRSQANTVRRFSCRVIRVRSEFRESSHESQNLLEREECGPVRLEMILRGCSSHSPEGPGRSPIEIRCRRAILTASDRLGILTGPKALNSLRQAGVEGIRFESWPFWIALTLCGIGWSKFNAADFCIAECFASFRS